MSSRSNRSELVGKLMTPASSIGSSSAPAGEIRCCAASLSLWAAWISGLFCSASVMTCLSGVTTGVAVPASLSAAASAADAGNGTQATINHRTACAELRATRATGRGECCAGVRNWRTQENLIMKISRTNPHSARATARSGHYGTCGEIRCAGRRNGAAAAGRFPVQLKRKLQQCRDSNFVAPTRQPTAPI